jgi:hypothetical protein
MSLIYLGGRQPMGPVDYPVLVPELTPPEREFVDRLPPADPDLVVGVVDTGVALLHDAPHPYLTGHLTGPVADNADTGTPGSLFFGHGSFVAARILMEAPTATIDLRRALDRPSVDLGADDAAVAAAIRQLADDHGGRLAALNLSFAGNWDEWSGPEEIRAVLADLPHVLVVAATANRWNDRPSWPAAFTEELDNVIAVGAVDETVIPEETEPPVPLPEPDAAFGSRWSGIDAYASGVRVLGPTVADGKAGWCRWSGTSFAAASVSGILARARAVPADWRDKIGTPPLVHGKPYLASAEQTTGLHVGGGGAG